MNRPLRLVLLALIGTLFQTTLTFAQSDPAAAAAPDPAPLTAVYEQDRLNDLPTSDSLFALFETMQPSIISDRFSSGGLNAGQPARLGGFLSSWTQTTFRVDGITITDPSGTGMPLLVPNLGLWQRVAARTGMAGAESAGTGLAVDLTPLASTARWTARFDGATSHGIFAGGDPTTGVPPIGRLHGFDRGTLIASGPLVRDRLSVLFAGSWTRGSQFDRATSASRADAVDATLASGLTHIIFTPTPHDSVRVLGWLQRNAYPYELRETFSQPEAETTDKAGHAQVVWERARPGTLPWRTAASYSVRLRTPEVDVSRGAIFERLVDGPVPQLTSLANEQIDQWSVSARTGDGERSGTGRHRFQAGIDAVGSKAETSYPRSIERVGELVHGIPARAWRILSPGINSRRHSLTIAADASDRLALGHRATFDAGVRFESATGSATDADSDIAWRSVLPRVRGDWRLTDRWDVGLFGGYARSMRRLALDDLAVGDPSAPTAQTFRWDGPAGIPPQQSPSMVFVARSGPGGGFSEIDPDLKAPTTDEYVIGIEARPRTGLMLRLAGVSRREHNQLALTNVGINTSSYDSFIVQDPGGDVLSSEDDQTLTIYNRRPASFGADRYLLTNTPLRNATFEGVEITIQAKTGRLLLTGGATAGQANGAAASRGFGPLENDQTILGELLTDPNAATLARGRLFSDRAYTAKLAAVIRFPADVRLGTIARYQDGQAFSRMLVFPGLNQGTDFVRAFSNGESRFLYIGTLDTRLQKGITVAGTRLQFYFDAYNLLNLSNSVEEDVAAPPDVRIGTALQPPRTFHVGVRVGF